SSRVFPALPSFPTRRSSDLRPFPFLQASVKEWCFMLSAESSNRTAVALARTRYARIPEVLPIPNLIELQLDSFQWFIEKGLRERSEEHTSELQSLRHLVCRL